MSAARENIAFSDNQGNTRRIISNSLALFLRMIFVTIVNIYSVRFVLKGLGVVDYGIFYAIMGVVLMGTFLIPVVSSSLQRFYSYSLGRKDEETLKSLFSISCNIVMALSVLILLVMEIVGLWYINNYLNIPADKAGMAIWVYQAAIVSFIFTIWLVPFTALIFSHEDMRIYAFLSCLDCALKFAAALMLLVVTHSALLWYSGALFLISLIMLVAYGMIAKRKYAECEYHLVTQKTLYVQVLSFSGWTLYGALAGTTMIQGSVMVLNFFFGPLANAAFAVANNLYNAFNSLANSIVLSFKPAMVKVYAEGNTTELGRLFYLNNKLMLYLLTAVSIPIIAEMRTVLSLWLGSYTEDMVVYCRLFIVYTICQVMHNPITTIMQSTGDIKAYFLFVETMMLLSLPINIGMFANGAPSYYLFVNIIMCCALSHIIRVVSLKRKMPAFSIKRYAKEVVVPGCLIVTLAFGVAYLVHHVIAHEYIRLATGIVSIPAILFSMFFLLGITTDERKGLVNVVKSKIGK